ncbi:glycosyltransferase family 4 protein [Candidatus Enterovibrio altilux]|uniref:Glycosyltransferase SypJ n=1 Tax=Candidatus Enterovibrio altilux TaxID=1927128 RepID=A0A291B7S2_9GAMM|nr:glycosyltransferase family 4 protein [Candidatus Enterovibrio luxaltus]ATF09040.1 Glycosyltransferase SypJ [Candidatus Enterovibrio luxaltus]
MNRLTHIIILDPVAFAGGSKISTKHVLSQLKSQDTRVTILTADPASWSSSQAYITRLRMPQLLKKAEQGMMYFARHLLIAIQLLWLRLFVGQIHTALGASGPGVDLALYLVKPLLSFRVVQMVHGPVAPSRTIGRCFIAANSVFYLDSTQKSLSSALNAAGYPNDVDTHSHIQTFRNGLPKQSWPSQCQYNYSVMFWAASLLKWKGLDTFMAALSQFPSSKRPETHICYIRPQQNNLAISGAPQPLNKVFWHHSPANLDEIRARANIFVSTSIQEPFGLSILEAMAAGMCVIIPADGAFWDKQLTENINCLKYYPNDINSLSTIMMMAHSNIQDVKTIGRAACKVAHQYDTDHCFMTICEHLVAKQIAVLTTPPQKEIQR